MVNDWEPECAFGAIKHVPLLDLTNPSKNYVIQLEKIVKLQAIVRYYYISNLKKRNFKIMLVITKVTYLIIAIFASDKELLKYICIIAIII